jgi:peroxiredoxin Q/BCP
MKRSIALALALVVSWLPAHATLDIGEAAPAFETQAAMGGKVFNFSLSDALAKGPVVVYFFPAAFSVGCSIEAHTFAESIAKFEALKTTVIGVSGDDIDTLTKFSVQECQNKFPVGTDNTKKIMTSFDAVMTLRPEYANRISFLIAPNGKIVYEYKSLNPFNHVNKVLAALQEWSKGQPAK